MYSNIRAVPLRVKICGHQDSRNSILPDASLLLGKLPFKLSPVPAAAAAAVGCTDLTADAQTFTKAAANRRTMLAKLKQVPGRSALSPAMLTDLTDGWQASATVDADLANWATSEAGDCTENDIGNPAYTASLPYDSKATNDKKAFVQQWNGLARKYGLATYQPSQI